MGNIPQALISSLGSCVSCCLSTSLCFRTELDSQELTLFIALFRNITLTVDPYYGQSWSLQSHSGTYQKILRKQSASTGAYLPRKQQLTQLSKYGEGCGSQNIIGTKIVALVEKPGFIETTFDFYLSQDFIVADLSQQFRERQSILEDFSEREIRIIIKECCKGFLRLDLVNYNSIRMDHIYFCSRGEIKIAHPKLFNYVSNLQLIFQDHSTPEAQEIYLSPQELKALQTNDTTYFSWNSNAFSFGIIILSLMSMNNLSYLYHYKSCEVDLDQIGKVIKGCKERYSRDLIEIVEALVQPQKSRRLTFKDLLIRLEKSQITKRSIDLHFIDPTLDFIHSSRFNSKGLKSSNKQLNYLAAFIHPRVSMEGEYARLDEDQERISRFKVDSAVANQRIKYKAGFSEGESFDNYLGEARKVQQVKDKTIVREGKGLYRHSDGQTYLGQWHLGKMHGFGKLFYSNGQLRYEGQFKDGLFDGQGIEYADVQIAEREQEIDEEYVKIYRGNWIKYQGHYLEDKKSGAGKIYFRNGVWKGNFSHGQPNGDGVYWSRESNRETKGRWRVGVLVKR